MKKMFKGVLLLMATLVVITGCSSNSGTEEKREFEQGSWENNVYTNDFAQLKFELPEGWVYSSEEEINEMMELSLDMTEDADKELVEAGQQQVINGMMAQDPATGTNIQVMFENLSLVEGGTKVTAKEYLEESQKLFAQMQSLDANALDSVKAYTISGSEYQGFSSEVEFYGITMGQQYYAKKEGNYMILVVITDMDGSGEEVLKHFV